MKDYYNHVIQKYRRSGILLDTNILLLYLIGTFDIGLIQKFKRTANKFVTEDYITLSIVLGYFTTVATTPNILTEVSNLSVQYQEPLRPVVSRLLRPKSVPFHLADAFQVADAVGAA